MSQARDNYSSLSKLRCLEKMINFRIVKNEEKIQKSRGSNCKFLFEFSSKPRGMLYFRTAVIYKFIVISRAILCYSIETVWRTGELDCI